MLPALPHPDCAEQPDGPSPNDVKVTDIEVMRGRMMFLAALRDMEVQNGQDLQDGICIQIMRGVGKGVANMAEKAGDN